VPRLRLRGVGAAIQRLDAHLAHQRRDVQATDLAAFRPQKPLQHPAARERIVEMQLIDPPHYGQVGSAHNTRQVVDASPADAEFPRLPAHRQVMLTVDHRFALRRPALPSAFQKIVDQRQFSDLRMQGLDVDGGRLRLWSRLGAEHPDSPFQKLVTPLLNLVGVDVELLSQFRQRLLALDCSQRRLRLECRGVVPACSSCHVGSCSQRILRRSQAETPLIPAVQIPRATSVTC
jgi:hypothetical protein